MSEPAALVLGPTPAMLWQIEQARLQRHAEYLAALNLRVLLEVAEFMELPDERNHVAFYLRPFTGPFSSGDPHGQDIEADELPSFTTDLNVCAELEAELVAKGQGEVYAAALLQIVGDSLLALTTAPAFRRCEAMLSLLPSRKVRSPR